jgi:steroid delta-isomerase-like uncharacterized protein
MTQVPHPDDFLAREFYRFYTASAWAELAELLHPDFCSHYVDHAEARGRDLVIESARDYKRRFPDLSFRVEVVVANPQAVACWGEMVFTHSSEYLGVPASGRTLRATCIDFFTIRANRLASRRHWKDKAALRKCME